MFYYTFVLLNSLLCDCCSSITDQYGVDILSLCFCYLSVSLVCLLSSTCSHISFIDVAEKHFQDCFEENRTIVDSYPFKRYGRLNKINQQLGMGMSKHLPLSYMIYIYDYDFMFFITTNTSNSDTLEECPTSLDGRKRAEDISEGTENSRREVECTEAGGLGTWRGGQDNPHPCSQTEFGHTYTSKWSPPSTLPSPSPPLPSPPLSSPPKNACLFDGEVFIIIY